MEDLLERKTVHFSRKFAAAKSGPISIKFLVQNFCRRLFLFQPGCEGYNISQYPTFGLLFTWLAENSLQQKWSSKQIFAEAKNGQVSRKFAASKIGRQVSRKFAAAKLFVTNTFCFSLVVRAIEDDYRKENFSIPPIP